MTIALIIFGSLVLLVVAFQVASHAKRAQEEQRGWRLRFSADEARYEEKKEDGLWAGIVIETVRRGHGIHGLRLRSDSRWLSYPAWAADRKSEIISRLKEECAGFKFYEERGPNKPTEPTSVSASRSHSRLI